MATAQLAAVLSTAGRSSRLSVDVPSMSPAYPKAASPLRQLMAESRCSPFIAVEGLTPQTQPYIDKPPLTSNTVPVT
jgi:hypothetical protein